MTSHEQKNFVVKTGNNGSLRESALVGAAGSNGTTLSAETDTSPRSGGRGVREISTAVGEHTIGSGARTNSTQTNNDVSPVHLYVLCWDEIFCACFPGLQMARLCFSHKYIIWNAQPP